MNAAEIGFSLQRPLQDRNPAMAPTITGAMSSPQEDPTLTHKLRKPLVEKLRRERINSCIEQLRSLLSPNFLKQQPDSKLEKADVLEMTVCFLRRLQQHHQAVDSAAVDNGYSRCVQEMEHFLSNEEAKTQSQRKLWNHINKLQNSAENLSEADYSPLSSTVQTSTIKDKSLVNSGLWRPW